MKQSDMNEIKGIDTVELIDFRHLKEVTPTLIMIARLKYTSAKGILLSDAVAQNILNLDMLVVNDENHPKYNSTYCDIKIYAELDKRITDGEEHETV
ncbi:hypothetical protein H0W80_00235 [Candidatus Saccharibacteria bacterium]|nr:hypothetical protein [Candidatus Saccharibacteria bacterium]